MKDYTKRFKEIGESSEKYYKEILRQIEQSDSDNFYRKELLSQEVDDLKYTIADLDVQIIGVEIERDILEGLYDFGYIVDKEIVDLREEVIRLEQKKKYYEDRLEVVMELIDIEEKMEEPVEGEWKSVIKDGKLPDGWS